jgi:hypothetical protein
VWKSVAPLAARHLHKSSHNNNDESNNEDGQGGRRRHGGGTASRIVRWLRRAQRGLRSGIGHTAFQTAMFILVLVNALINASFVYRHNKKDEERRAFYYSLEVDFPFIARFIF